MAWNGRHGGEPWGGRYGSGKWSVSVAENTREGIATIAAGALTLTLGLASTDGTAVVDWGDGTRTTIGYTGSTYQNYGHTYAVAGTYVVRFINYKKIKALRVTTQQLSVSITGTSLTYLTLSGTGSAVTGVITGMPLTYLTLSGTGSAVTGVITGMPLTYLALYSTGSAVTGVITGMPLTYLYLSNTGSAITGVVTGMSLTNLHLYNTGSAITGVVTGMSLTYLFLSGTGSAVTGVQSELCRLTRQYYLITNDITIPSSNLVYGTWGSEPMRIEMATKLPAAMTDYVLQRLAAATISGANKTVHLKAEARTSASDAAYATLQAAGVTVTITG